MPGTILIVDDDPDFREEFRDCFNEYEVLEAGDGKEALETLKKPNEIDLVILDVKMPGMNGFEVLSKIKSLDPELGIIISTGYSSKDAVIEALRGQADNYIEKPLDIDKTREIIDLILDAKKGFSDDATSDIKAKIDKVKYFVEKNCYKKVKLEDAAAAVCLSPKYLSRVFKESTGKGFSDYKLAVKMAKAKELLHQTGYNVNQISDKLGYENTESFIRQFKKLAKSTPTKYRHKKKK
jgi:two-component system, response regulator YesN